MMMMMILQQQLIFEYNFSDKEKYFASLLIWTQNNSKLS